MQTESMGAAVLLYEGGRFTEVAEIATRLGYSQPSAFTRSTMRWFGATPRAYRKANA